MRKRQTQVAEKEFDQQVLAVRRVVRVVRGGRRFSFSAAVAIGNKRGKVGFGLGKAGEVALAVEKAVRDAKKHLLELKLGDGKSIPHEVLAKYGGSRVLLKPAPGRGVVAGSAARPILTLAGLSDVMVKFLSRGKNKINNARVVMKALAELKQ